MTAHTPDTTSPAFDRLRSTLSSRAQLVEDVTGEPAGPPRRAVPINQLAINPRNIRRKYNRIDETADTFNEQGQLHACKVVTRAAFLALYPECEDDIGDATWVTIDGNRRLLAARRQGLEELKIDVDDDIAVSRAKLIEVQLVSTEQHEPVSAMDEARALAVVVEEYDSIRQAAQQIGKTHVFISQRLALLKLLPELQEAVDEGELLIEDARNIARLPHAEQLAAAQHAAGERAARKAARADRGGNGVSTEPDGPVTAGAIAETSTSHPSPALGDDADDAAARAPGPRPARERASRASDRSPVDVDFADITSLAQLLKGHLGADQLRALVEILLHE